MRLDDFANLQILHNIPQTTTRVRKYPTALHVRYIPPCMGQVPTSMDLDYVRQSISYTTWRVLVIEESTNGNWLSCQTIKPIEYSIWRGFNYGLKFLVAFGSLCFNPCLPLQLLVVGVGGMGLRVTMLTNGGAKHGRGGLPTPPFAADSSEPTILPWIDSTAPKTKSYSRPTCRAICPSAHNMHQCPKLGIAHMGSLAHTY